MLPTIVPNDTPGTSEPPVAARPRLQRAVPAGGVPWIVRLAESAVADVRTVTGAAEFLESTMPGVTVVRGLGLPGQLLVDVGVTVADTADLGSLFAAAPGVAGAHADFQIDASLTPNDRFYGSLHALHNTGQSVGPAGADIDAAAAWDVATGSRAVVVAVIDEGIDFSHVDLAANMWTNPAEIPGNGVDDDSNGFVDDVHRFDFHNNRGNVFSAADGDLHGTHVTGQNRSSQPKKDPAARE